MCDELKTVILSIVFSVVIHFIYIIGNLVAGYIKSKYYKPDIEKMWNNPEPIPNEVAFGGAVSPFFYVFTFIAAAFVCGLIIFSYKKLLS